MPSPEASIRSRNGLAHQRTLVVGLAREGVDLIRFLAGHGVSVTAVDDKSEAELGERLRELRQAAASLHLGGATMPDLSRFDVVYTSPGVPPSHPLLAAATRLGLRITTPVNLFFELCPAPIFGITGSAGKTTTTTLVGNIFSAAGHQVVTGGNIGRPLLGELQGITADTTVVMELSSFQLKRMSCSPQVALITNVTPNHLDWHPSMEDYWESKGHILKFQAPADWAVLNADDPWSRRYAVRGQQLLFSLERAVDGAFLRGPDVIVRGERLMAASEVPLIGQHNLANVLAACCVGAAGGASRDAMVGAIRAFPGVAHRLQTVGLHDGVRYVNDSIATAPERSIAALNSFKETIVLIAGGRDKHLPMEEWARLIGARARHVVLIGEMSSLLTEALERVPAPELTVSRAASMEEAVAKASAAARPGDVVLLSPGGTSFDWYRDYEERGQDFAQAVRRLGTRLRKGSSST